jgi:integrase
MVATQAGMNTIVVTAGREPTPTFALRIRSGNRRRSVTGLAASAEPRRAMHGIDSQVPAMGLEPPGRAASFSEFASGWLERQTLEGGRQGTGLAEKSRKDLEWRLSKHLLPIFGETPLDQITRELVDDFRLAKVREGVLGATSINKLLFTLSAILETAVEYEVITRNTARGRRRRLVAPAPRRAWLDRADHIAALLDAAGEVDRKAVLHRGQRRVLLSVLTFAGLRIGEALSMRWSEIDLERGTIMIGASKTEAGLRTVNLLPVLHDELVGYQAIVDSAPDSLVFATSSGREYGATNIRRRILARAVEVANAQLRARDEEPLPERLTPHSLRRTFASVLFAIGEPPPYVMAQMGHTTPNLTLAIYARQMNRRDGEPERLKALVQGSEVPRVVAAR